MQGISFITRSRGVLALVSVAAVALAGNIASQAEASSSQATQCPTGGIEIASRAVTGVVGKAYCLPLRSRGQASRVDRLYTEVAEQILRLYNRQTGSRVHTRVSVVCWSAQDWSRRDEIDRRRGGGGLRNVLGYVYMPSNVVNLSPDVCRLLDQLVYGKKRPLAHAVAQAIDALAHETIHVAGLSNEARTECTAMQLIAFTSERLGLGHQYGVQLAQLRLSGYEGYRGTEYYTRACHNDSPLDLFPDSRRFP